MLSQDQARSPHPSDVLLSGMVAAPPFSRPRSALSMTVATNLPSRRHDRLRQDLGSETLGCCSRPWKQQEV